MYINPYLFFLLKKGKFIVWDYKHHKQFILESEYAERLKLWSEGNVHDESPLDAELTEANLILKNQVKEEEWGWDELAKIYHIGTKNISDNLMHFSQEEWIENYINYCQSIALQPPTFPTQKEGEHIPLPPPTFSLIDQATFLDTAMKRKTCRSFEGRPINLEQLSTLLYISLGPIHEKWKDLEDNNLQVLGRRKSFPSGGGLHPEEAYLIILNVEGLQAGVYHYNSYEHHLTLLNPSCREDELISLLYGQYFAKGIACGIFLTARFEKGWWKYPHSRGYRVILLDIGHASQSILSTATALGLDTWLTGAFGDSQAESFLKLSSSTEQPILFIGLGYGNNKTVDNYMLLSLQSKR